MKNTEAYIAQWVRWSGGLLVAWFLTLALLPDQPNQVRNDVAPSTCLSSIASHHDIREVAVYGHNAMVLATSSVVFSFLPSPVLAAGLVVFFLLAIRLALSARLRSSFDFDVVCRLLFEHQIAINAP